MFDKDATSGQHCSWRDYLPDGICEDQAQPTTMTHKSAQSTFHGKECKGNCQGHIAGYRWAKMNSIDDESACINPSTSFGEGCASYVEENGFLGMARVAISWIFIIAGGFFMASGMIGTITSYFHVIAGAVMIMTGWLAKGMYAWWPLIVGAVIAFYMAKLFGMKQRADMINALYEPNIENSTNHRKGNAMSYLKKSVASILMFISAVSQFILWLLGIGIYVCTIVIAWTNSGIIASIISAVLPFFSQLYWAYNLYGPKGLNLYHYSLIAWCAIAALALVPIFISVFIASSADENSSQQ